MTLFEKLWDARYRASSQEEILAAAGILLPKSLSLSMQSTVKITYTTPESVKLIIARYGTGTGILNTPEGLYVDGVCYPKGTVFEVGKGVVREFKKQCPAELMNQRIAGGMLMPYRARYIALMKAANDLSKPSKYRAKALMLALEVHAAHDEVVEQAKKEAESAIERATNKLYDDLNRAFLAEIMSKP